MPNLNLQSSLSGPNHDPDQKEVKQIIAPAGAQVFPGYLKIGDKLAKTFFVFCLSALSRDGMV
jgi:hypothetical protein